MSHSVFTQKKVTILLQSFKGVQYLQKVDNECDCVINRFSVNHSTRLNYTRPIISRLSLLEKRPESEDSSSARSRLRQNIYNRLRNLSWESYTVVVVVSYQVESEQNPESLN